jgi:hypothetical protein
MGFAEFHWSLQYWDLLLRKSEKVCHAKGTHASLGFLNTPSRELLLELLFGLVLCENHCLP